MVWRGCDGEFSLLAIVLLTSACAKEHGPAVAIPKPHSMAAWSPAPLETVGTGLTADEACVTAKMEAFREARRACGPPPLLDLQGQCECEERGGAFECHQRSTSLCAPQ